MEWHLTSLDITVHQISYGASSLKSAWRHGRRVHGYFDLFDRSERIRVCLSLPSGGCIALVALFWRLCDPQRRGRSWVFAKLVMPMQIGWFGISLRFTHWRYRFGCHQLCRGQSSNGGWRDQMLGVDCWLRVLFTSIRVVRGKWKRMVQKWMNLWHTYFILFSRWDDRTVSLGETDPMFQLQIAWGVEEGKLLVAPEVFHLLGGGPCQKTRNTDDDRREKW